MKSVAIIGSGFTGAYIAHQLKDQFSVTVFEKARGVGGRMSTRYHDVFEFDHGVPSFKATHSQFIDFLKTFEEQGVVRKWEGEYVAVPRMNQWVKTLLKDVEVISSTLVQGVDYRDNLWHLKDENERHLGSFDLLISTAPPIQSQTLLESKVDFDTSLKVFSLKPCFVLMLGIHGLFKIPPNLAAEGIEKIIINSSKPQRPSATSIVVYMDSAWSEEHLEMEMKALETSITKEIMKVLDIQEKDIAYQALHRWRYAKGDAHVQSIAHFWDEKKQCGACGDWCFRGDVESAFLAANILLYHMSNSCN